ncbi:SslE/AcfD family lipoprotein zinc metalloprotease [Vibrio rotiferianus]|uniref:SslE/AcfD family lipoprotein zinc metalloprotease n=1 Tax=Vibrio rotiferianus TaxID=190895 RepID=UPI00406A22B5
MKKKLIAIIINTALLSGCHEGSNVSSNLPVEPETPPVKPDVPPTDPDVPMVPIEPIVYSFNLLASGIAIEGATCDGNLSEANGILDLGYDSFNIPQEIDCSIGTEPLASFTKGRHYLVVRSGKINSIALDINNSSLLYHSNPDVVANINKLLMTIDGDGNSSNGIQLNATDPTNDSLMLYRKSYANALDFSVSDFISSLNDQEESDTQPGHGTDIMPEVTPGDNDVSSGGLVSVGAEKSYQYVPETPIPETSHLILDGQPVVGIKYFGPTYRGVTDENGQFEYNWGETITFSIEALTLGETQVKGIDVELRQLTEDAVRARNIETLITQFDKNGIAPWVIEQTVRERFEKESNNIVELINLSLPNGQAPSKEQATPNWGSFPQIENEFKAQFKAGGSAENIVNDLGVNIERMVASTYNYSPYVMTRSLSAADELAIMMGQQGNGLPVKNFHVFTNTQHTVFMPSPEAASFINISNSGAPVVMARNDMNADIPFGGLAKKDKLGRPFVQLFNDPAQSPTYLDSFTKIYWNLKEQPGNYDGWSESSYYVNKDTATFGLPFVVTGRIGQGRLLVLGNTYYNSILVSPNHYSFEVNPLKEVDAEGNKYRNQDGRADPDDMFNFFVNAFEYLAEQKQLSPSELKIGTNRTTGLMHRQGGEVQYDFKLHEKYTSRGWSMSEISPFGLDPVVTPIYILQAYESNKISADTLRINEDEVTALIDYVNQGGNVVIMETLRAKQLPVLGRLLDTAGLGAIGTANHVGGLVKLHEGFIPTNIEAEIISHRPVYDEDIWLLEGMKFASDEEVSAEQPPEQGYFYDEQTNTYYWGKKSASGKTLLRALFRPTGVKNRYQNEAYQYCQTQQGANFIQCKDTFLEEKVNTELVVWKQKVKELFKVEECKNPNYDYELDCIELRKGNGIPLRKTRYGGANDMSTYYKRLPIDRNVSESMIAAANMGTNLHDLYQHELYYRSNAHKGHRLSSIDVDRIYNNLSAWMWNNEQYRYDGGTDEFGHKQVVELLNCYSNNHYGNPTSIDGGQSELKVSCPDQLKQEMINEGFLVSPEGNGNFILNPSYPLNYMEKPLTRIMLGRSYYDASEKERGINVDLRSYPGVASNAPNAPSQLTIYRGSRQSTGVWAEARETIYVTGLTASDSVTVAMADNLVGRVKHEMALNRPPRVSVSIDGSLASQGFEVPYGGLIYITLRSQPSIQVGFSGAVKAAPIFRMSSATQGHWEVSPEESDVPLAEVVSNRFVFTTTTAGLKGHSEEDILTMATNFDLFSIGVNEFYGLDEMSGVHKKLTDGEMPYQNMRMVDDIQISIGFAHSGYPVMRTKFPTGKSDLTNGAVDWVVSHEIGHNLATKWFNVPGAGETANNILGLYNQERNTGEMSRIKNTIIHAPEYVREDEHPWANGTSSDRLNFFGQLKIWAEDHFDISRWESQEKLSEQHSIYNKDAEGNYDQGWNLIKLIHRKARESKDEIVIKNGNTVNYCSADIQLEYNVTKQGMLMVCSSYLTGIDLSLFFNQWNVGEIKQTINFKDVYSGGIKDDVPAKHLMDEMKKKELLNMVEKHSPLDVESVSKDRIRLMPEQPYF